MRRKNIALIDEIVKREFAKTLSASGFFPFKDNTEWVRIKNGEIVQIVLFYEYHYWLEIFFYSELLSEFLWFDYRSHRHMDKVIGTSYCNVRKRYGVDICTANDVFASGSDKLDAKIKDLHRHLYYVLEALDEMTSPEDILDLDPNEKLHPERVSLHYASGNGDLLSKALLNASELDPLSCSEDEAPERLSRDYWRVWRVKRAFVCRKVLQSGNTNALKYYTDECRRYNIKYLKRHMPQLFEEKTDKE